MRGTFVKTLIGMMEKDENIMVVSADMGFNTFEPLRDKFPERFINTGISEADAAGISAGLALSGHTVFFFAQASFVTLRCFEQIRLDIASNNLNVKIVGGSSGITLSQYGVSHFALEDVAAMRALPNMAVMCPGDLYEAEEITKLSCSFKGPAYIRIGRTNSGPDVFIHPKKPKIKIGEPVFINKQNGPVIISTGSMLFFAKEVVEKLRLKNICASFVSLPTVKPLNSKKIIDLFKKNKIAYVFEEHSVLGGLGSAISEIITDKGLPYKVVKMGTQDKFLHVAGSREYLLGLHGLATNKVVARIIKDSAKI